MEKGSEMISWVWSIGVLSCIPRDAHYPFPMHTKEVDMFFFLGDV